MKAKVIKIEIANLKESLHRAFDTNETDIIIESDKLSIENGVYFFENVDTTNPNFTKRFMVAVFPIDKFYIIRQE